MASPQIELRSPDSLTPYTGNPKSHPSKQIDAIASSISEYGFSVPLVVNTEGVVLSGHGRLEAARRLGLDKVPCIVKDDLTPAQQKGFRLADNRVAQSDWLDEALAQELKELEELGFDLEQTGFDTEEIDELLKLNGNEGYGGGTGEEDEVPDVEEVQPREGLVLGSIWQLGRHKIGCLDSTDEGPVRRLLGNEQPLLMITDPPYGVDYDPNWRNEAAEKGLISYAARSVGKVMNDDRVDWSQAYKLFNAQIAYVWHAGRHAKEVQSSLETSGYTIISQIIWAKPTFAISRGDYHWQHEPCWYAVKKGKAHNWQGSRSESTIWQIARGCAEKTGHGTEKPVECMERPIRNNSEKGDLIADPFLGSGSTLIACERTNRTCVGSEINPAYCEIILQRFFNLTQIEPELIYSPS